MGITTSTEAGRVKLLHPDYQHDGGTGLWNKIHDIYKKVGDSLVMQWEQTTLANAATKQFVHNFGLPLSKIFVRVFIGSNPAPTGSYSLTNIDNNTIQIQNLLGHSETFNYYVWALDFKNIFDIKSAALKTMGYFSARYTPNVATHMINYNAYHKSFVAISNSATTKVLYSKNGIDWESKTNNTATADLKNWRSCCNGLANGSRIVAVADGGTDQRVMYSDDGGLTWTLAYSADDLKSWVSVIWCSGWSKFVAVASGGTGNRVMTSSDGITWALVNSGDDTMTWRAVAYSPSLNRAVIVASSGTGGRLSTSTDGVTWTKITSANDTATMGCIAWSETLGRFVILSQTGTGNIGQYSANGTSWTTFAQTSTTAVSFAVTSSTADKQLVWSSELGLFVAALLSPSNYSIVTSPTGYDQWTLRATENTSSTGVCWSPDHNLIAACQTGSPTNGKIITNRDMLFRDLFY
jgi:hypothetical protein